MPTKFYIEQGHGCIYYIHEDELYSAPINTYGLVDLEEGAPVDLAQCQNQEDEAQLIRIRNLLLPRSSGLDSVNQLLLLDL